MTRSARSMFNKIAITLRTLFKWRMDKRRESVELDSLYRTIGYRFENRDLLEQAMTHRSSLLYRGRWMSNERLEFLGDSVLGFLVTDELYKKFPEGNEGDLTKAKSILVSREALAQQARKIDLGQYLILGRGEERSGGRTRRSILSNAYEALIGAMYLDGGVDVVRRLIRRDLCQKLDRLVANRFHHNYKSWLLEFMQARGEKSPIYRVMEETGPDHNKQFTVQVIAGKEVMGQGTGLSKKRAEKAAAREAIKKLGLLVNE
ncbi:ribonuclease III [candidate division KSB1 bacterium]|nr:ribonuclease III [candidate division KSB1 bacterium]